MRLGFAVTRSVRLGYESTEVEFAPAELPISFRLTGGSEPISQCEDLVLLTEPVYQTAEDALSSGRAIKRALMIGLNAINVPVYLGGEDTLVEPRRDEKQPFPSVPYYGLVVIPESMGRLLTGKATWSSGRQMDDFEKTLGFGFRKAHKLDDGRLALAFELYNAAHFEESAGAMTITLITAIETLSSPGLRSESYIEGVERLIKYVSDDPSFGENAVALRNYLGNGKRVPHGAACKELIANALSPERARAFTEIYKARGTMLHEGKWPDEFDLGAGMRRLDDLVGELLFALLNSD